LRSTNMKRFAAALLMILIGSAPALAATYWSSIATGCAPDSTSITKNRYRFSSDNAVLHQTGNVDAIALICNISPNPGATLPTKLSLTYRDSTGSNAAAQAVAELVRVKRSDGNPTVTAALSSDGFVATALNKATSAPFAHQLNFESFYYFVRLTLDRTTTAQDVKAFGVALEN
jgi:hypothetical protein